MDADGALWHRIQFAFTITYHYLFPQLTMGLAWFLVYWKWRALRTGEEKYDRAARFWAKIFGLNFGVGVVTGIPMEFQFGTNWADFSRYAGGVIGQTLAMEGMFAFFLETLSWECSSGAKSDWGRASHFLAAVAVAAGSWLSAYFILVTNAFMQHPVGYLVAPNGSLGIANLGDYLSNRWAIVQFCHNQLAAVVTGSFVVAALGAFIPCAGFIFSRRNLSAGGHACRFGCLTAYRVSDRRPAGQNGRPPPASHACRHGGKIHRWWHGRCRCHRSAERQAAASR